MEVVSLAPNWQSSIRAKEAFRSCAALQLGARKNIQNVAKN